MKKSLWLARLLHTKGPQTKQQILNAWSTQDENGRPMAQSTFYDNCKYVAQQMGLNIKLQSDGKYHITNPDGVDQILTQMLCESQTDTTSTADLVLIYCRQIMEAIDLRQRLQFEYKSTHTAPYLTTFEPYCVRTIRNFIYTVGYSHHHRSVRIFALDRILSLSLQHQHYTIPTDFNGDAYFRDSFGAFAGKHLHTERIILQVAPTLAQYLEGRPLHESQRTITTADLPPGIHPIDPTKLVSINDVLNNRFGTDVVIGTENVVKDDTAQIHLLTFQVAITRDLVAELLSYGPELRVLCPTSLANIIHYLHHQ
jgi:predicted DNA-binding transcriptional regulator YafY